MIGQNHYTRLTKHQPYQRSGSGDGEREESMTRQMPHEPFPASVLFALILAGVAYPFIGVIETYPNPITGMDKET